MGRRLYRVPLDFSHPLNTIWPGYLRHCDDPECDDVECPDCEPHDPPTGLGYQLWETTTEGSPQSPVFATLDALATWCETHATTFADFRATKAQWLQMFGDGQVYHQEGQNIFI